MIPIGPEAPSAIRQMMPWFALGHGIFNTLVMSGFCYQGWLGHVIRRNRLAGTRPPLPVVRRHRRLGILILCLYPVQAIAGLGVLL